MGEIFISATGDWLVGEEGGQSLTPPFPLPPLPRGCGRATSVFLCRWARGWGRTYPGARGAVAASRGQLHQHEQQVGREQAGAARGQHGASGLRAGVAGSAGRTAAPALLLSFPRGRWRRRRAAGSGGAARAGGCGQSAQS